jgi:hypothetical protein
VVQMLRPLGPPYPRPTRSTLMLAWLGLPEPFLAYMSPGITTGHCVESTACSHVIASYLATVCASVPSPTRDHFPDLRLPRRSVQVRGRHMATRIRLDPTKKRLAVGWAARS